MGRPPLQTVRDMINVVFALSESSKLEDPPLLLYILKITLTPTFSFTPSETDLHVQLHEPLVLLQ